MSTPLSLYSESLRRQSEGEEDEVVVRFGDGRTRPLLVSRWIAAADEIEERALGELRGPVLDVGCGPGRHLHALARRGVFGLGVDLSPVAVGLARGAGARAIVGSIFDELPGGRDWASALLLDGNIGIGGDPARLLRRVEGLLAAGGRALVELESPGTTSRRTRVRLESGQRYSDWFAWAQVSTADIGRIAHSSGFVVQRRWTDGGRWFALMGSA